MKLLLSGPVPGSRSWKFFSGAAAPMFALLASLVIASPAAAQGLTGWAWVEANSTTLNSSYTFNSTGGGNSVTHSDTGVYVVNFPGMGEDAGGTIQISAYNGTHHCAVDHWSRSSGSVNVYVKCYNTSGALANGAFTVLYYREPSATSDRYSAYLWADQPSAADYSPNNLYQWNSQGNQNTVQRSGPGQYTAILTGLSGGPNGGHVQVTGYGTTDLCKVRSWSTSGADLRVYIGCYDNTGAAADSRFTLSFFTDLALGRDPAMPTFSGYAWASSSSLASYTPNANYSLTTGSGITAGRSAQGVYSVTFAGIPTIGPASIALVTAYGSGGSNLNCGPEYWFGDSSDTLVSVQCRNGAGALVDSQFDVLLLTSTSTAPPLSIAAPASLSDGMEGATYSAVQFNATGGTPPYSWSATGLPAGMSFSPTGQLSGVPNAGSAGDYTPTFTVTDSLTLTAHKDLALTIAPGPSLGIGGPASLSDGTVGTPYSPVMFTSSGGVGPYVWTATGLPLGLSLSEGGSLSGTPLQAGDFTPTFTVTDASDDTHDLVLDLTILPLATEDVSAMRAWAMVDAAGSSPDPAYSYNSAAGINTVTHGATGSYTVHFPNIGVVEGGNVQVSAFNGPHHCDVDIWGSNPDHSVDVWVHCFDISGTLTDGAFTVFYFFEPEGATSRASAYLWAGQPANDEYTPSRTYQWNSRGNLNTVQRSGPGQYTAILTGLASTPNGGHVQVSAYNSDNYCRVGSWFPSGGSQLVGVYCFDKAATPADTTFTLTFLSDLLPGVTPDQATLAGYAWANQQGADSYIPNTDYSLTSAGSTTGSRQGTGAYTMTFQDLLFGAPSSSIALVTAYGGAGPITCDPTAWNAQDANLSVQVRCQNAESAPVDAKYDVLVLTSSSTEPPLAVSSPVSLTDGQVGQAYAPVQFSATGGTAPYSWSATGLPDGLSFSATGELSGTPNPGSAGAFNPTFTVTDATDATAQISIALSIQPVAFGAPSILTITNSASGLAGPVAGGELITLKGTFLPQGSDPAVFSVTEQNTVADQLAGIRVLFDNIPGTPIYVSREQINAIAPYEIIGRVSVTITVEYLGTPSSGVQQQVGDAVPGIFTLNSQGFGQASALNVPDYSFNGPADLYPDVTYPAPVGQQVVIYLTGAGQTNPASVTGSVTPGSPFLLVPGDVSARIGGVPATVAFIGGAPGLVNGVIQVNLIPDPSVHGDDLALDITIRGVTSSAGPSVAIE